ncbi:MAG TPA: sporulation protein YunB [Bacillota bacterium]|nr:sporulation protein YunB [Bacillota bacterium]
MQGRRRQQRKMRGSFFPFILLAVFIVVLIQGFLLVEKRFRPVILAAAEIKANGAAIAAINQAIMEKVAQNVLYQDLVNIERDDEGRIVMARVNTMGVNRLSAQVTLSVQEALEKLEEEPLELPLGEATGSYFLATYGPKIPVRLIPMGKVNTELDDQFEAAGINQTRHKIYLRVDVEAQVVIPFTSSPVKVATTVPIADSIYLGEVPETVINLQFPPLP